MEIPLHQTQKQTQKTTGKYLWVCFDTMHLTQVYIQYRTATPTPGSPKTDPSDTPQLALQGPSQLLTALLTRLPDATNRAFIDQAAVDFAFLNSKAARKRLIKV